MTNTTANKTRFTREELADVIKRDKKYISALCSKSKNTLIPDPDDPNIIDLSIQKNATYINKKILEVQLNIKPPPAIKRKKAMDADSPPPKKKAKGKQSKKTTKKEVFAPEITDEERNKIGAGMDALMKKDDLTLRKLTAEAELKELEVSRKRGDLISASEVAPFIKNLSKRSNEIILIETMSLVKEMAVEYELDAAFQGRFERDYINILNKANEKTINEFKEKLKNGQ